MVSTLVKLGLVGTIGTLTASHFIEKEMKNFDANVEPPIDAVTIITPTFNEEQFAEKSLSSIRNQSIIQQYPEYFELILVDSNSTDKTLELAKPYVDKVISVNQRGKLTARNIATNLSNGNIIVSTDSDTYYDFHWLNTLLKPFKDNSIKNIVGVVGSTFDPTIPGIPTPIRNVVEIIDRKLIHPNQMIGRNSAFYKHAFYLTGQFNENINQFDVKSMVKEEEQGFGERLSKIGKIAYKLNASCFHMGGVKIGCRLGTTNGDICKNYGIKIDRFG